MSRSRTNPIPDLSGSWGHSKVLACNQKLIFGSNKEVQNYT